MDPSRMNRDLPVSHEVDVVIAGGGTSGFSAAIAAARNGASTLLIEKYGFLGGNLTAGNMVSITALRVGDRTVGGMADEVIHRLAQLGEKMGQQFTQANRLGGGTCPAPDSPIIQGIDDEGKEEAQETARLVHSLGGGNISAYVPDCTWYNVEAMKFMLMEMCLESSVQFLLHTVVCDVIREDNSIRGIVVENKSGRSIVRCKNVVDCTGDADIAARAGAPCDKTSRLLPAGYVITFEGVDLARAQPYMNRTFTAEDLGIPMEEFERIPGFSAPSESDRIHLRPVRNIGLSTFKIGTKGQVLLNRIHVYGVDGTNADDLTRAEIMARQQAMGYWYIVAKYIPGFEDAYLTSPTGIAIRETRRIIGEYVMTTGDTLMCRHFEDAVVKGSHPFDLIDESGKGGGFMPLRGPYYYIPYRSLQPKGIENLLVTGRCISVSRPTQTSARSQATVMSMGQSAGTAAAMSVLSGIGIKQLDVKKLQRTLLDQGSNCCDL